MTGLLVMFLVSASIKEIRTQQVGKEAVEISIVADAPIDNFDHVLLMRPSLRIVISIPGLSYDLPSDTVNVGKGPVDKVVGFIKSRRPLESRIVIYLRKSVQYRATLSADKSELILFIGEVDTTSISTEGLLYYPRRAPFLYSARYKRDPFSMPSLKSISDTLLEVNGAKLVGVLETPTGRVAVVRAYNGRGFVLHEHDIVKNGIVSEIGKDYVIFTISDYGFTRTVVLRLKEEE